MSPAGPQRPRGLGRGLDALLPARMPSSPSKSSGERYERGDVFSCALEKLVPQQGQPRQHFRQEALEELAASIREHGLLEPLVVRRVPGKDQFEIIAGERRWRASQRAGLREVLVVVHDVSPAAAFELALIENIQREDLDPIEFAEALDRLVREGGYTQESVAQRVGKDRSTVANALRLLKLPPEVRHQVVEGQLSEGHARALLGAPDVRTIQRLAEKVVRGHLSVRQTEALVRSERVVAAGNARAPASKSASVRDLEQRLARKLGARCEVRDSNGKGQIVVRYGSLDELDRLLELLL